MFDFVEWERETDLTGDGSGDPNKYIITIRDEEEEVAVIVHRASELYPLDGDLANRKLVRAERVVKVLNDSGITL